MSVDAHAAAAAGHGRFASAHSLWLGVFLSQYAQLLFGWLALFAASFLLYMFAVGVDPAVRSRCNTRQFSAAYGQHCLDGTPDHFAACYDRCRWEMHINLMIETMSLVGVVALLLAFLAWDASRVQAAILQWRYHPLRAQWHSDLVLFNRYADRRTPVEAAAHPKTTDQTTTTTSTLQPPARTRPTRAPPASQQETKEEAKETTDAGGLTYGSVVGESAGTTRRRKDPLAEVYQEKRPPAGEQF